MATECKAKAIGHLTDWPRLANCVTVAVCLRSSSCIHHRALLRTTFPARGSTGTLIRKEFSSGDSAPSAPGSALHRSSCESHLVFLEFSYTSSRTHNITPSCSRWYLEFRNVTTVKLVLKRAHLLRAASQSSTVLVPPASPIWEELQVWRVKLQLLLLKWQTKLHATECHADPSMSLCVSSY